MQTPSAPQLVELIESGVPEVEVRLERIFGWRFERELTTARALFALAGIFILTLVAAVLQSEVRIEAWQALALGAGASGTVASAIYQLRRIQLVDRRFIEVLVLHRSLRQALAR